MDYSESAHYLSPITALQTMIQFCTDSFRRPPVIPFDVKVKWAHGNDDNIVHQKGFHSYYSYQDMPLTCEFGVSFQVAHIKRLFE